MHRHARRWELFDMPSRLENHATFAASSSSADCDRDLSRPPNSEDPHEHHRINTQRAQNGVTGPHERLSGQHRRGHCDKQSGYARRGKLKGVVATSMNFVAYVNRDRPPPT